jgi:hypothetical protein
LLRQHQPAEHRSHDAEGHHQEKHQAPGDLFDEVSSQGEEHHLSRGPADGPQTQRQATLVWRENPYQDHHREPFHGSHDQALYQAKADQHGEAG